MPQFVEANSDEFSFGEGILFVVGNEGLAEGEVRVERPHGRYQLFQPGWTDPGRGGVAGVLAEAVKGVCGCFVLVVKAVFVDEHFKV